MPVTFQTSPVKPGDLELDYPNPSDRDLLRSARLPQSIYCRRTLQSSVSEAERPTLIGKSNGFVRAVLEAYGSHCHLRIRPDDVWIAVLSQLSFYMNAHADDLREYFVAHEGRKRLILDEIGTRFSVDYGRFAREMTFQIRKNVVDKPFVERILPDFTTTTAKDTTICSILTMATLRAYFEYRMDITCGIPTVTLEGNKSDWERILKRLDRLYELGDEPSVWAEMLRPILRRFVSALDGERDLEFWKHIVYRDQSMCGQDDLSGWLTAFCVWKHDGTWNAGPLPERIPSAPSPARHPANACGRRRGYEEFKGRYTLDGIPYFTIAVGSIPGGY
ncbi:hypothetical protein C8Q79DRAFT_916812 [Trametes meyenii]|nr:hypothetical protein C8Q79DRAFT_916812 [Trametes meyenii]